MPTLDHPTACVAADFDHDGRSDLAVASSGVDFGNPTGFGTVEVFLSRGLGTLSSPAATPVSNSCPVALAAADLNNDGSLDLVLADAQAPAPALWALINDGAGVFSVGASAPLAVQPKALAVGDLDHDGNVDVVIAGSSTQGGSVAIVKGIGGGGFLPAAYLATSDAPNDVALGQFNGDAHLDLVATRSSGGVSIFLGTGTGAFGPPQTFPFSTFTNTVAIGDLDGDLDIDVVSDSTNALVLQPYLNDGSGTFSAASPIPGPQVFGLEIVDVDGDARPDLLGQAVSARIAVWRNLGGGTFAAADAHQAVGALALCTGDLDGDGSPDVVMTTAPPYPTPGPSGAVVFRNDGSGRFGPLVVPMPSTTKELLRGDLDHDGREDLVAASASTPKLHVALHQPSGAFNVATLSLAFTPLSSASGSLNADNHLDVVVSGPTSSQVGLGNGAGGFAPLTTVGAAAGAAFTAIGDATGDGFGDLVAVNNESNPSHATLRVHPGDGAGGFTAPVDLTGLLGTTSSASGVALGRFNADNREDIVYLASTGSFLVLSSGAASYSAVPLPVDYTATSLRIGDLDGDGDSDLVIGGTNKIWSLLGDGLGGVIVQPSLSNAMTVDVEIADWNGDGKVDVAGLSASRFVSWFAGNGLGGFAPTAESFLTATASARRLRAIDADLDGKIDVAFSDTTAFDLRILVASRAWEHPHAYCVSKATSNGCAPSIAWTGTSSATATAGFAVTCAAAINNKPGLLIYSSAGRAQAPFFGGTLCVKPPLRRSPGVSSGGNPPPNDCSGAFALDLNAFAHGLAGGNPDPALLVAGNAVTAQWWGRDPGYAPPNNVLLSNALDFLVGP